MNYVDLFIQKFSAEAPDQIHFSLRGTDCHFKKVDVSNANRALVRYKGNVGDKQSVDFEFQNARVGESFNRLDLKVPGKSSQITCFHFIKLGFMTGEPIIDITQIIKFSGKYPTANKLNKEFVIELLKEEDLLDDSGKRWYLGTFDNIRQDWLYGRNTTGFISDFLKLGIIFGHLRGNKEILLPETFS